MVFFEKNLWEIGRNVLSGYLSRNNDISRCYIRHSAAFGPQNPFLSDFDLTFFVKAHDASELRKFHLKLRRDFKNIIFPRNIIKDSIIFPATSNAYNLCRQYYPLRSIYPMETWLNVDKGIPVERPTVKYSLPLDHAPENLLSTYLYFKLTKKIKGHPFERALLNSKLKRDYSQLQEDLPKKKSWSFYEAVLAQVYIWDKFYKRLDFSSSSDEVHVPRDGKYNYSDFLRCWSKLPAWLKNSKYISSVWVYPVSHNDTLANLAINLNYTISPDTCRKVLGTIIQSFGSFKYTLLLGTEESMISRINGLNRVSLLEPWLFKYYGNCLFGDTGIKRGIIEPGIDIVKRKYMEFLVYFSYRFICQNSYAYPIYRLCFTLDRLFTHKEIVLDGGALAKIYGSEFIPEDEFNARNDTPKLILSLRERHGFDMFGGKELS